MRFPKNTLNSLNIKYFEPGALVPALETFDAVSSGVIDAGWSTPSYWAGERGFSATPLFSSIMFNSDHERHYDWIWNKGGWELLNELYGKNNVISVPCGISTSEGFGWFKNQNSKRFART